MAAAMLRKSSTQFSSGAARIALPAALQERLLGDPASAALELVGDGAIQSIRRPVSTGSTLLGSLSRTVTSRSLCAGISLQRDGGVHWSRGLLSRSFYAETVGVQRSDREESNDGEARTEGSSNSRSVAMQSLQPSLSFDDFRSLIVRKKSEVAILEAALDILETAPRDKRFEDLVRKHNLQVESKKSALVDFVGKPSFDSKNGIVENNSVGLEPVKTSDSQLDGSSNAAKPLPPPTMFGRLSLNDFPAPRDPNLERLQKKRRRLELLREYERKNKMESLNFGAAGKSFFGDSKPRVVPPVDPLKPNADAFPEKPEKVYKSLADRLYEEQFGHPAPPGLKRTYPKGSFYDRCMKEKERKEREAAAAAAAAARVTSRSDVPTPSPRPIESVSPPREEENSDNSTKWNFSSNDSSTISSNDSSIISSNDSSIISSRVSGSDANQERKPGAWKCRECTFFNLSGDKFCYKCQAQREEDGERRSAMG